MWDEVEDYVRSSIPHILLILFSMVSHIYIQERESQVVAYTDEQLDLIRETFFLILSSFCLPLFFLIDSRTRNLSSLSDE